METFSQENQKSAGFSTYLAIGSFGIGTLLFLLHFALPEYGLLYFIGYFYLLIAFFINLLVFLCKHFYNRLAQATGSARNNDGFAR